MFTVENVARYTLEDFRAARKEMRVDSDEFRKFMSDLEGKDADTVAYEFADCDVVFVYNAFHAYITHEQNVGYAGYDTDARTDTLEQAEEIMFKHLLVDLESRFDVTKH